MIERTDRDGIAVLQMQHGKANALDVELCSALDAAFAAATRDRVRAVVLTGTGGIFSAGVDLKQVVDGGDGYISEFLPALGDLLRHLLGFTRPVVAAINGHAIAGGAILAAAADRRLMASGKGRIGVPELLVGVPFPTLAIELLRAIVTPHRLQQLIYSGVTLDAQEAPAAGLVDELVAPDTLLEAALGAAAELARIPPGAFAITKQQLRAPLTARLSESGAAEAQVLAAWRSEECRAALAAYVERTLAR